MSKLKELLKWAESQGSYGGIPKSDVVKKLNDILANEQEQLKNGKGGEMLWYDASLWEDLSYFIERRYPDPKLCDAAMEIREILNRHRPSDKREEPLAVLADRKGYFDVKIVVPSQANWKNTWEIGVSGYPPYRRFNENTYPATEAAARQYLMSLPDKEDGK